jgi:hypothetical protein
VSRGFWWLSLYIIFLPSVQPPASSTPATWYRGSRRVDLTGANARDSVVLVATGTRADSLAITMTLFVSGAVAHVERWTSADELSDVPPTRQVSASTTRFMRARLDTILTLVKRQPINREQVANMGDVALLRQIAPRPTHQIMVSYGFENSLFLVWDPRRRQMRVFMECC